MTLGQGPNRNSPFLSKGMLGRQRDDNRFAQQCYGRKADGPLFNRQPEEACIKAPATQIIKLLVNAQFI